MLHLYPLNDKVSLGFFQANPENGYETTRQKSQHRNQNSDKEKQLFHFYQTASIATHNIYIYITSTKRKSDGLFSDFSNTSMSSNFSLFEV